MGLSAAQRRVLLAHPAGWIATGFGSGLAPLAPGTVGSAAALLPWLLLRELPLWGYLAVVLAVFALGVWVSKIVVGRLRLEDPGCIVIDEFVGQWLALALAPAGWAWMLAGFLLFRLFDVWKPWPVSWADRAVDGGLGVMLDDALAGLMAGALLGLAAWMLAA
jgi:phosphatidylglycerophosphatase A